VPPSLTRIVSLCVAAEKSIIRKPDFEVIEGPTRSVAGDGRHIALANDNGTIYIFRLAQGSKKTRE